MPKHSASLSPYISPLQSTLAIVLVLIILVVLILLVLALLVLIVLVVLLVLVLIVVLHIQLRFSVDKQMILLTVEGRRHRTVKSLARKQKNTSLSVP